VNVSINVLLVDDSKVNLFVGKKILEKLGATVFLAESGNLAITMCKKKRFDLILMDIEMPDMNGIETVQILRQERLSYAPIFAVTGHDSPQILKDCHAALMTGHLSKPLKLEKVQKLLHKLFGA